MVTMSAFPLFCFLLGLCADSNLQCWAAVPTQQVQPFCATCSSREWQFFESSALHYPAFCIHRDTMMSAVHGRSKLQQCCLPWSKSIGFQRSYSGTV
uniref:Secreted protein n=1 Tax=Utricularia reniformis TaxID=192314 RepID=A0A1Y0AZS8_9LAMI|nr:hypothetical protein AEK19_MT0422 [Utricularia reniformis]ART30686.1 hypothetical protein AEK19_MT0422 [Utricularia reniformis]